MSFPISGSHSIDAVASGPPLGLLFSHSILCSRSEDRNNKFGVAGELLVRSECRSMISRITANTRARRSSKFFLVGDRPLSINKTRKVRSGSIHEKYRGLLPRIDCKTADFVYSEIDGVLTKLFIENTCKQTNGQMHDLRIFSRSRQLRETATRS